MEWSDAPGIGRWVGGCGDGVCRELREWYAATARRIAAVRRLRHGEGPDGQTPADQSANDVARNVTMIAPSAA